MDNRILLQEYLHPTDRALSQRIMEFPVIKQLLNIIFEKKLDAVNYYLYNSSCIKLPGEHPAVKAFQDGKRRFGINTADHVYVVRSYDFDVRIVGYTEPVVLVSSRLIEENDSFLLKERVATSLAAISAGHHKLEFLLWIYENFSGMIQLPVLSTALTGLISEWQRSRQYTLDRAFLLYTGNYLMTKKNILYGTIPYSILKNFNFGGNDTYFLQVCDFYRQNNLVDIAASVFSVLQHEIWIPARYKEIQTFYQGGGEKHGMDMQHSNN
ncbi:MAG: hypothetical protein Q4C66_06280 [Lachnospiraceae bacterium]|nr:hypothetical protein [Lachnospiraceae bacterium]